MSLVMHDYESALKYLNSAYSIFMRHVSAEHISVILCKLYQAKTFLGLGMYLFITLDPTSNSFLCFIQFTFSSYLHLSTFNTVNVSVVTIYHLQIYYLGLRREIGRRL